MLLARRMVRLRFYIHENYIDDVLFRIGQAGVLHQTDIRESLKDFDGQVHPVEPSERLFRLSSVLSRIQMLISTLKVEEGEAVEKVKVQYILADKDIDRIEENLGRVEEEYAGTAARLAELRKQEKSTELNEVKEQGKLSKLVGEIGTKLLVDRERLEIARQMEEAKTKIGKTKRTYVLEGWAPQDESESLTKIVKEASSGYFSTVVLEEDVRGGHEVETKATPPTNLKNPRIAYVYEKIATAFGIPNYQEVDPSIFMLFSFPAIFGLMFGDVGHGSILLAFSLMLYVAKMKNLKTNELFNYLIQGSPLLIMCSIAAIIVGFLYGEVLGSHHFYEMVEEAIHGVTGVWIHEVVKGASLSLESLLSTIAGFRIRIPFPFSPFQDTRSMLLVSIYVAIVHISFGLVLGLINEIRGRRYKEAILGPGLWIWFYFSFAYLFLRYKSQILAMIFQRLDILGLYIILPAIVMIVARSAFHGMDGFGHALESLIASLSNTISYGRILALALAHSAFSSLLLSFTELDGTLMIVVGWTMWAAFTFLLILCFESLLSFIHTLRLHWVEWFLKFYSGTGIEYRPFTIARRFTTV